MKRLILFTAAALALAIPLAASAAGGFIRSSINLRAGPGWDYPRVARTLRGERIEIFGCTGGWHWCDVSTGPQRGWVAGSYVQFDYQGRLVPVYQYGERIGVPVVTFELGNYWDTYYRGRDFYGDRDRWDRSPGHGHDHDHRPGGWDRHHYRNNGGDRGHAGDDGHDGDHSHDGEHGQMPPPRVVPMPHPIPGPPVRRGPVYPSSDSNDTSARHDTGSH